MGKAAKSHCKGQRLGKERPTRPFLPSVHPSLRPRGHWFQSLEVKIKRLCLQQVFQMILPSRRRTVLGEHHLPSKHIAFLLPSEHVSLGDKAGSRPLLYRPLASPTEPSFVLQAQPSRFFRSGLPRPLPFFISKTPFRFSSKFSSRW